MMSFFTPDKLLISLMKLWQRVQFRPPMFSATDLWRRARIVLICFPEEYRDRLAAEPAVRSIVEAFPAKRFFILTTKALPERWLNAELIQLRGCDLNIFSLPNSDFIKFIQDKAVDVAIDLWPSFSLTNASVCRRSCASLRVGFGGEHAASFYNLMIIPRAPEESLPKQFEAMAETILNLERSEAEVEA